MSLTFLNRTMDAADFDQLHQELPYVDHHLDPAHAHLRWHYAIALHAVGFWVATGRHINDTLYDIGEPKSKFGLMLDDWTHRDTVVVDRVEDFCVGGAPLADIITAHGVVERVPDPEKFLYYCSCLLAPGGLLALTFAYWNHCGPDLAADRDQRLRIYCPSKYSELRHQAESVQLRVFGAVDRAWHGAQHHDYTFASLMLEKRR